MIFGIGTDIIELERVENALLKEHFKKRVFSKREQDYCEGRKSQRIASYAARFAAKEAIGKALKCGISGGDLTELEILNEESGAPKAVLCGKWLEILPKDATVHITLSHSKKYATAECIIEG